MSKQNQDQEQAKVNVSNQTEAEHLANECQDVVMGCSVIAFNGKYWQGPGGVKIETRLAAEAACRGLSRDFKNWTMPESNR